MIVLESPARVRELHTYTWIAFDSRGTRAPQHQTSGTQFIYGSRSRTVDWRQLWTRIDRCLQTIYESHSASRPSALRSSIAPTSLRFRVDAASTPFHTAGSRPPRMRTSQVRVFRGKKGCRGMVSAWTTGHLLFGSLVWPPLAPAPKLIFICHFGRFFGSRSSGSLGDMDTSTRQAARPGRGLFLGTRRLLLWVGFLWLS